MTFAKPDPQSTTGCRLLVKGIVQGVGFRPFVARLARGLGLGGSVANTGRGVEITLFGPEEAVAAFRERLVGDAPPMALIMDVIPEGVAATEASTVPTGFTILSSRSDPASSVIIPPDIATCDACVSELTRQGDRREGYAFINCTDCGPRYTIIDSVPYDRPRTAMSGFELCAECRREYEDQEDRRFHAQPNACPVCGPTLKALDAAGEEVEGDPIDLAITALNRGETVALLGVGGFHLACDATSEAAVEGLRSRKARPAKPFAVMAADLGEARKIAEVDEEVQALLTSAAAPIVLCPEREDSGLASGIAPGQSLVGVFLPYTPLHHLLFSGSGGYGSGGPGALVMTSGNRSDEPIISSWAKDGEASAAQKLRGVADLFLVHDRPIVHPVDDSVVKSDRGLPPMIVRRARGYAPTPIQLASASAAAKDFPVTLCLGAELCNTFAVVRDNFVFVGPHVGDLKNIDTEEVYHRGVDHLLDLLQVEPELVVTDLHPDYRSTVFADRWRAEGVEVVAVQHHEAHAAACMGDNGFDGEGIALTLDGVGLGHDGTLWGGELLVGRPGTFERVAHLACVPLPGGDRAAKEPWRMAAAHLRSVYGESWTELKLPAFAHVGAEQLGGLEMMMDRGLNSPLTSSCGRLFDAASAILGFTGPMLYSAQAPMEFEALALRAGGVHRSLPRGGYPTLAINEEAGAITLDPAPLVEALAEEVLRKEASGRPDVELASLKFHEALARSWALVVAGVSQERGLKDVFLSGGCFQNSVLTAYVKLMLEGAGLNVYLHRRLPPNDGGISFGQAAWVSMSRER
jgi:hydrogenase maturation protein HypF